MTLHLKISSMNSMEGRYTSLQPFTRYLLTEAMTTFFVSCTVNFIMTNQLYDEDFLSVELLVELASASRIRY